jgi:ketosteroid isomerase-like protein
MAEMTPDRDLADVEEANARFYRAFESLEIAEMDLVWSHGDHVRCVHPGWCLLTGWEAVRQSWEAIFRNTGEMRFSISDVHACVEGNLGWVTCTENILSHARGQIAVTALLATNLFERRSGEWLMVHHHASHTMTSEPSGST